MQNIGKIAAKAAPKYTKGGFALISKKMIDKYTEMVHIKSDFGRGNIYVISTFDESGNIVRKTIRKPSWHPTNMIERLYRRKGDVLFTKTEKSVSEKVTEKTKESFHVKPVCNGKKMMTRMKLTMKINPDGSRDETQVYEDLVPKGLYKDFVSRTFSCGIRLKTTAKRLPDGKLTDKTIEGNLNLDELTKDPYLYIRNYDRKDFVYSAQWIAQKKQGVIGLKGGFKDKNLDDCAGFFRPSTKNVFVDSQQGTKAGLVNTINHEFRHKWQHHLIDKYIENTGLINVKMPRIGKLLDRLLGFFNIRKRKITMGKNDIQLAKMFYSADKNYCQPEKNYSKYFSNDLEIDARNAGKAAEREYQSFSERLAEIFDIPKQMTYCAKPFEGLEEYIKRILTLKEGAITVVQGSALNIGK